MIVIIDYEMGNLRSVYKAFKRLNTDVIISQKSEDIHKAKKLVLPGIGHFKNGMNKLKELSLIPVLTEKVINESIPILGICLGMQLLTKSSEEGDWVLDAFSGSGGAILAARKNKRNIIGIEIREDYRPIIEKKAKFGEKIE